LGFSFVFGFDPVLVWGVFDVFWGLHWVSLGFPWSSCWKSVNCGMEGVGLVEAIGVLKHTIDDMLESGEI
jgi:hypothetical protein